MRCSLRTARAIAHFWCVAVLSILSACRRTTNENRSAAASLDSAGLVHLAITDFRQAASDSGPLLVTEFRRAGDSIIVILQPTGPPGELSWRSGGQLVLRNGAVVSRRFWQRSCDAVAA